MKILLHLRYVMVTYHIFKCGQKSAQKNQSGLDAVFSLLENVGNKLWVCEGTQTCTEHEMIEMFCLLNLKCTIGLSLVIG